MKILYGLAISIALFSIAEAWPRLGVGATPVTQSNGDKGIPFSVMVGTTTTVRVYTRDERDREILFQNTSSDYYIHCATYTPVVISAGSPRFMLPPKPTGVSTNATYSINCLAEPGAGGEIEVIGVVERDSKD